MTAWARRLRTVANWIEDRHRCRHPYVRTLDEVRRDIRRILSAWPGISLSYNDIYRRSSMEMDLEKGLEDLVARGLVLKITETNGEPRYSWVG